MTDKHASVYKVVEVYIRKVGLPHEVDPEVLTHNLSRIAGEYCIDTTVRSNWPQSSSALSKLLFEGKEQFAFKILRKKSGSRGRTFLFYNE